MARDLNDTLIFAKVVEHGSFISAARALRPEPASNGTRYRASAC